MSEHVSVRYIIDDVEAARDVYSAHFGFEVGLDRSPAFAEVLRGGLRLLLSGAASSGARATPPDHANPGRNRIHLVVEDLAAEVARLEAAGVPFASEVVSGPGGSQVLVTDPS